MPVATPIQPSKTENWSVALLLAILVGLLVAGWSVLAMLLIYLIVSR